MNKLEALKEIFEIDGVYTRLVRYNSTATKKIDITNILNLLSKKAYNLTELGLSAGTVSKLISSLFPDKPKDRIQVDFYLFHKYGYKHCTYCETVKPLEEFNKNTSSKHGVNVYCKVCHNTTNSKTQANRTSKYRAAKLNRTPAWANLDKIKIFYDNCPPGYHVDHIIPLQGETVSGLHVLENLQYLLASENLAKHNSFSSDSLAV